MNLNGLKNSAELGAKFDLAPLVAMAILLIGMGVTNVIYSFAPFNLILYIVITCVLGAALIAALIIFCIGAYNRKKVIKAVFNYADEITAGVTEKICTGDSVNVNITLSEEPDTAVMTLKCKDVTAVYDLTPVLKLNAAASAFIAACIGGLAVKIKDDLAAGKVYKEVLYSIGVGEGANAKQYLVKSSTPDDKEIGQSVKIYDKYAKKYKKA